MRESNPQLALGVRPGIENSLYPMSIKIIQNLNFTAFSVNFTPVYNFINDRLADESAVLRPLS